MAHSTAVSAPRPAPPTVATASPIPAGERDAGPTAASGAAPGSALGRLVDRALDLRDRILASERFQRTAARLPIARAIARHRSRAVFDLCAGFVYAQVLAACVRLDLFARLAAGSATPAELALDGGIAEARLRRLLDAAVSLRLLRWRHDGRVALGALGAPLAGNAALATLVRHHAVLYDDLRDPLALLRADADDARPTGLAGYWPYAAAGEASHALPDAGVARYSETMTATLPPVAEEVLDACDLGAHQRLLDVGGGEGVFCALAAARHARLECRVFELPAVARRAEARFARLGLGDRVQAVGGNFLTDALPAGADVITLVRVLLDHADDDALRLLRRARAALPRGGRLVIAEALAGARGAEPVGAAYFGMYLLAMGHGRARRAAEYHAMLRAAGFRASRELRTRYPVQVGIIVADA